MTIDPHGEIFSGFADGAFVIRLVGNVRLSVSVALEGLIADGLAEPGLNRVFIDLRMATGVDSTTLGLLAKISNHLRERQLPKAVVISDNADIGETLSSLGFDDIFEIVAEEPGCPVASKQCLTQSSPGHDGLKKTVLGAHEVLRDLNARNHEIFEGVVTELKPKPSDPPSSPS